MAISPGDIAREFPFGLQHRQVGLEQAAVHMANEIDDNALGAAAHRRRQEKENFLARERRSRLGRSIIVLDDTVATDA
jgi:hypothetical protein